MDGIYELKEGKRYRDKRIIIELYHYYLQPDLNGSPSPISVMHGESISFYQNGATMIKRSYSHGKLNGEYIYWNQDGQIKIIRNFKDDLQHGKEIIWYDNGQKYYEREYNNGQPIGIWKLWYETGELAVIDDYTIEPSHFVSYKKDGSINSESWSSKKDGLIIK